MFALRLIMRILIHGYGANTGLLLNFNANSLKKRKSGLIICLLYRAKLLCSNNFLFFNEVGVLRNMFVSKVIHFGFLKNILKSLMNNVYISILHFVIMFITLIFHISIMTPDSLSIKYKTSLIPNFN